LPATIQDEITPEEPDEKAVQSHKGSCSDAQANHLQRSVTYQLKKWKDDQRSDTLQSLGMKMTMWVTEQQQQQQQTQ
jgi:hypothetical protein